MFWLQKYTFFISEQYKRVKNEVVKKRFLSENGKTIVRDVELFTWEKTDKVDEILEALRKM